jgi:hypothetical protein
MTATATATAPQETTLDAVIGATIVQPSRECEESAILAVWSEGRKHNIEFGRLCYEYGQKYGAQGSANNGLAQFLRKSNINEGVAYYWINEFKASVGAGIPCPDCTETFPSKTKLRKHQHRAHGTSDAAVKPAPVPVEPLGETPQPEPAPAKMSETTPAAVPPSELKPGGEPTIPAGKAFEEAKAYWDALPKDQTKGFGRFANYRVSAVGGHLDSSNRGNGMAVDRLRTLAFKFNIHASVTHEDHGFTLRIAHLSEKGAREILKFIGEDEPAKQVSPEPSVAPAPPEGPQTIAEATKAMFKKYRYPARTLRFVTPKATATKLAKPAKKAAKVGAGPH